jgi:hypothetical protein
MREDFSPGCRTFEKWLIAFVRIATRRALAFDGHTTLLNDIPSLQQTTYEQALEQLALSLSTLNQ